MERILNKEAIIDVIYGATLLGGGGGGSLESGIEMLDTYEAAHPNPTLTLVEAEDMAPGAYAAVTAGMGAPQAIVGEDFSPYAINAFQLLQEMAARSGKKLAYSIPVEMGGFNTFVPMLISMSEGIKFVDCDGAGRAVPALETLMLHVNGCDTSPLAMANSLNDRISIELADSRNAVLAEKLGRDVCIEFGMKSGLSGWMVTKEQIKENIVCGSITLAEHIGRVFRAHADKNTVLDTLFAQGIVVGKVVCKGTITDMITETVSGFDVGRVMITDEDGVLWQMDFQNENLLISKIEDGKKIPYMTVPDIICMHTTEAFGDVPAGLPLTNADVKKGMKVAVGAIAVDENWFKTPEENWWGVWVPYMERIGYTDKCIRFKKD